MSTESRQRAWLEVDASALRRNFLAVRSAVGADSRILPMVKADAYGLGALHAVRTLEPLQPWGYGVATVDEGLQLREWGVERPVVLISPLPPGEEGRAWSGRLTPTVSGLDGLERILAAHPGGAPDLRFQVEVDSGMGRAGVPWWKAAEVLPRLRERGREGGLTLEACYTHFHSADEEGGRASMEAQWGRFQDAMSSLPDFQGPWLHGANSAAVFRADGVLGDGCRPGIHLFGGRPGVGLPAPEPLVALRARVVRVEQAREGDTVGYGALHRAGGGEWWATVALGYGDGLRRSLFPGGQALFRGERVPIVGRISMDLTVVECSGVVGDVPPQVGEIVTFLGRDGGGSISLDEMAAWAGTIHYELLTGFTPRLPRIWHDNQ